MLFNSYQFLIFFPVVVLLYYVIPQKIRYLWLLAASYYFYMCWNAKYALLLLFSTLATYISGYLIDRIRQARYPQKKEQRWKSWVVAACCVINLGILFYFKYANFSIDVLKRVLELIHIQWNPPSVDVLLPVGISFYTFQALSYTIDVYRGEIPAEKNFFRYALFVSFFPQLVAGPIERSKNLLTQLAAPSSFNAEKAKSGLMLMLWGFFLKIVLADRIAIFVDFVYGNFEKYNGLYIAVATVLFAVQIYCDFAGYSTIAIGAAEVLGIDLMENFDAPYLATSVAAFWRRWHISLTSWFKDYVYIPLGGSRKGVLRKYINKMIVFLLSGLWHGADFSFVVWGALNGAYQIIGEILMPLRSKIAAVLRLDKKSAFQQFADMAVTFLLVDFSWIFFRANSFKEALAIIKAMVKNWNPWIIMDGSLYKCGLDEKNFTLMLICIGILLIADIFKKRGLCVRRLILAQPCLLRLPGIAIMIVALAIFGIWGPNYNAANFIYFQF